MPLWLMLFLDMILSLEIDPDIFTETMWAVWDFIENNPCGRTNGREQRRNRVAHGLASAEARDNVGFVLFCLYVSKTLHGTSGMALRACDLSIQKPVAGRPVGSHLG